MTDTIRSLICCYAKTIMSGTLDDKEIHNDAEEIYKLAMDSGWIRCKDRLPERAMGKEIKRDWYIVTLETGMVTLRAYEFDERSPFGYGFHEQNIIPVIAWQPLPDQYKPQEEPACTQD